MRYDSVRVGLETFLKGHTLQRDRRGTDHLNRSSVRPDQNGGGCIAFNDTILKDQSVEISRNKQGEMTAILTAGNMKVLEMAGDALVCV